MGSLSYYLSSIDMPASQADTEAYGPVKDNEDIKYRVTSKLAVDTKTIYAVADGEIIVCNVNGTGNTDKVNIFLKPKINYASLYYIGMPKVKYFVYRGVKKSSFFDTNGDIKTNTNDNDVLKALNTGTAITGPLAPATRRQNFKDSFDAITNLANTYIDPNNSSVQLPNLIDTLFVKEDYNQIKIDAGDKLGISGSDFGFEIMLEENGFNPTIEQAKSLENIIDTTNSNTQITKKLKQLEILNYIDPAAFFGLFFRKDSRITDPKDGKELSSSTQCYNLFLSKLRTGTRIYLDIRNKYALPVTINTTGKEFSQIKISVNGSSPSTVVNYQYFKKDTTIISTWPIHIIDENFSNSTAQGSWYDYYRIKVAIENKNPKEFFHVITNHLGASWENKRLYKNEQRLAKLTDDSGNAGWKNAVELRTLKATSTKAVASYIRVEVAQYSNQAKIDDQVVNYRLDSLTAETLTHQISPTIINLKESSDLTRERDATTLTNKYKTHISGMGTTTYSETRGVGCELTQGKAIDAQGEICFAYRTAKNLTVDGIDFYHTVNNKRKLRPEVRLANKGERSNQIGRDIYPENYAHNRIQNAYKELVKTKIGTEKEDVRSYEEFVKLHNEHKKNKSLISVHKVKFTDGAAKKGIDFRINDPIMIRGLIGNSPAECFLSISYTYAERQTISSTIEANFETARFVSFVSNTLNEITTSGRKVFKQTFKLLGLKANGNNLELQEQALNLIFYSFDGANFATESYANGYKNEDVTNNILIDRVITNDVIPAFDFGNPFDNTNFMVNTYTDITTLLSTISNNENRNKVLYNEVRDYIYDGDLDNLTYEIAFRLPFFMEDIRQTPYTQIMLNGTSVPNCPYLDFFAEDTPAEEWFTLANTLRGKQVTPALETLNRSGLTASTAAKKSYEQEFYDAADTKKETYFTTVNLPVNAATTFNWENPKSYFNNKGKYPHLPYYKGSTHVANTYELGHLKTANVITVAQKTALEALATADFGYEEISDGTYTINGISKTLNGKYVFKEKNESTFKIYDFSWYVPAGKTNNSGITFGFGYDIGAGKTYTNLLDYINVSASSVSSLKETVLKKGLGKKKIDAMKEFYPFKSVVWDTITLDYDITIGKTKPILQSSNYLGNIISWVVANRKCLKIYKATETDFYKNDELKILNVPELCMYSTFVWNTGGGRAIIDSKNSESRARGRILNHAYNTHDIRWLRYFVDVYSGIAHNDKVIKFLSLPGIIKHYRK